MDKITTYQNHIYKKKKYNFKPNRYMLCKLISGECFYYDNETGEKLPIGVVPKNLYEKLEYK